jgi:hypothetical protein
VIVKRQNPEQAYESVVKVWSPEGPWRRLAQSQLRKAGISFEPYQYMAKPSSTQAIQDINQPQND